MLYSKTEKYVFSVPKEYKAYLDFKNELKEMGVHFVTSERHNEAIIEIHTQGSFNKEVSDGK